MSRFVKRAFDIIFALSVLIVCAPVFMVIALAILIDSGRPVLFRSIRVGLHGEPFLLTKFRTMVVNAQAISDVVSTPIDDARITRVGHLLRHLNFDELPQFFDVLIGNMSVVGPRPEVPRYVSMFTVEERAILSVRPGITDWASLWVGDKGVRLVASTNPELDYQTHIRPRKIELQLEYVRSHSFVNDMRIIAMTFKTHIFGRIMTLPNRVLNAPPRKRS